MNLYCFCESCLNRIVAVSDDGFVLADVHDLSNVQLNKKEVGADYKIGAVSVAVTRDETTSRMYVRAKAGE